MFERAFKFIHEQRIEELKRAISRTPDSPKNPDRWQEISERESKLEEINQRLLSK